jgi:endosialidase-like protein
MPKDLLAPGRLIVGKNVRDAESFKVRVVSSGEGAEVYFRFEAYEATGQPNLVLGRARGTAEAPAIVQAGDILGELEFFAYSTGWRHCAEIASTVCGTPAAGVIPDSDLQLKTTVGGGLDTIRVRVMPDGRVTAGAGATQTEAVITANAIGTLWVGHNDGSAPMGIQRASADTGAPSLYFRKSRGTLAAPATVANADELAYVQAGAYTNAWHDNLAAVAVYVDAAVVAGQRPATRIALRTQINNAGGPSDRLQVLSGGAVIVGPGTADSIRYFHVVGPTTTFSIARIQSTGGGATNNCLRLDGGDNAVTGSTYIAFHRPDGTEIGSIKQNAAGTVQYNTSSDERLKENITDMDNGIALVAALRPRRFNFRGDAGNVKRGFIAQEVHQVIPELVSVGAGTACACDLTPRPENPEGVHAETCCQVKPWAMDYGLLTPVLVKAVQELNSRLEALENG